MVKGSKVSVEGGTGREAEERGGRGKGRNSDGVRDGMMIPVCSTTREGFVRDHSFIS